MGKKWIACLMDCGWNDDDIRMVTSINAAKMLDIDLSKDPAPVPAEEN